jgi:hypothetical protein
MMYLVMVMMMVVVVMVVVMTMALAKVVQLYIPCLWWCVHDLTNRCRENFFPNHNIYLMEEAANLLKRKAQVQEDNVRKSCIYLYDGSRLT